MGRGRPKKNEESKKSYKTKHFRLSKSEYGLLKTLSKDLEMTETEVFRQALANFWISVKCKN